MQRLLGIETSELMHTLLSEQSKDIRYLELGRKEYIYEGIRMDAGPVEVGGHRKDEALGGRTKDEYTKSRKYKEWYL